MRLIISDRFPRLFSTCIYIKKFESIQEEQVMNKATSTLIAAVAALALSGGAYAQSNNTLATPSVVSPAAVSPANATSGYGTSGATNSDSGMSGGSANPGLQQTTNTSSTPNASAYGVNNTLATPGTASPAGK